MKTPQPDLAWELVEEPIRVPFARVVPAKPVPAPMPRKQPQRSGDFDDVLKFVMQHWKIGAVLSGCCVVLFLIVTILYFASGKSRTIQLNDTVATKPPNGQTQWGFPTNNPTTTRPSTATRIEFPPTYRPSGFQQNGQPSTFGSTTPKSGNSGQQPFVETFKGHSYFVQGLAYSPDGKQIASGSTGNNILLSDAASGATLRTLRGHTNPVTCVAYSHDGKRIASGTTNANFILWDAATGEPERTFTKTEGQSGKVESTVFSIDDTLVVTGLWGGIVTYNVANGQRTGGVQGRSTSITSLAFSPNGKLLAAGGMDRTIRIYDGANGQLLHTITGIDRPVLCVAFSPNSQQIACGTWGDDIAIWNVSNGQIVRTLRGHDRRVNSLSFSLDGKRLASGSDDSTIRIWDMATGQTVETLQGHKNSVLNVAFSPDGKQSPAARGTVPCASGMSATLVWGSDRIGKPFQILIA